MIEERLKQLAKYDITDEEGLLFMIKKIREEQEHQLNSLNKIQLVIEQVNQSPYQNIIKSDQQDICTQQEKTKLLKRQVFFCQKLQDQVILINQFISEQDIDLYGFMLCVVQLHDYLVSPFLLYYEKNPSEFNERILKFVEGKINQCQKNINTIYGDIIRKFLEDINFPTKNKQDRLQLTNFSQFEVVTFITTVSYSLDNYHRLKDILPQEIKCIEWRIFDLLNEACFYHFIDQRQPTARSDKPEWFFIYIYDVMEANLSQLDELDRNKENQEYQVAKNQIASLLYEEFCLHNIKKVQLKSSYTKKIQTNEDDLIESPEIAIIFMESAQLFEQNVKSIYADLEGIYAKIIEILYQKGIISGALKWECQIFEENLFSQMDSQLKQEIDKKGNLFLGFIDDFVIIWKKLRVKYQGIKNQEIIDKVDDSYFENILKTFCNLSVQYFKLIHLYQEDSCKINFLQTFAIGLTTFRKQFSKDTEMRCINEITSIKKATIKKYVNQIEQKITDAIMKQVYPQMMNESCIPVYQQREKLHLYQNQGFYFLEQNDQLKCKDGIDKLNNYYLILLQKTRPIVNELVIARNFNIKLSHQIAKALSQSLIRRMFEWASQSIKFSIEGINVYCLVVIRTTIQILMSQMSMDGSTHCQNQMKRYEMKINIQKKRVERIASVISKRKLSLGQDDVLSEEDQKLVQNLSVIYG